MKSEGLIKIQKLKLKCCDCKEKEIIGFLNSKPYCINCFRNLKNKIKSKINFEKKND